MADIDDLLKKWMDSAPVSNPSEPARESSAEAPPSAGAAAPDLASLLPMFATLLGGSGGNSDAAGGLISSLLPALGELGSEDETTRLLAALKPFMNGKRSANIDMAVNAARILRVARAATKKNDEKDGGRDGL